MIDTNPEIEIRVVGDMYFSIVNDFFFVDNIKTQMQVRGHALHSINQAHFVEHGAAALSTQAGTTEFDTKFFFGLRVMNFTSDHAFDGKLW